MDSLKTWLTPLIESSFLPTDDDDLRIKKVALTMVPLVIWPTAIIWGVIYFLLGHPLSGSIPMTYSIVTVAGLVHFFRTKKIRFIHDSQLLMLLFLPFLLMWSLGGFAASSMVMLWAIFSPIAALMFLEKRAALLWFLAYCVLILISGLIDGYVAAVVTPLPALARSIFYLLNVSCVSGALYLLVSSFISQEKRAIKGLQDKRKRLEERTRELEATKDQIKEVNLMLHTVLDTIPVRIFWKDRNLVYLGCNRLFAQDAAKSSPQEVIGMSDYDMSWRDTADLYRADDRQVIEGGQPKLNFEEPQSHPDGTITWLRTSKAPLRDASGKIIGVLGTYEDITAEKRHEQDLIAARDEATRANQAKDLFLASMSHELRTPLNAVLGFGELLEADVDSGMPVQQEFVKHILTAGQQLLGLIDEILDLSRIETGKLALNLRPLRIADLTSSCVSQVAAGMANQRNITIENTITDATLLVQGDDQRLRQVLINLLTNAVKYNKENGRVTLSSVNEKTGRLRIEVRDTGAGIAPDKLSLLFSPFERLEQKHGSIPGVGIGLHITKQLVEAMNGAVGVESVRGQGSTFWFELPLAEESAVPVVAPETSTQSITQGDARFVVLYIEDNLANVLLAKKALQSRPYIELLVAGTAEEGLTIAEEERPDLILMDIQLPGIDGITATTLLKKVDATREIPVVALSANAMQEDIDRALNAGCSDYLTKPIGLKKLYEVIERIRSAEK
jgi:PAS domain S-box-containing protein